jgi:hypothetical protein
MASPRRQGREVALQILCASTPTPISRRANALALYHTHLADADEDDSESPGREPFDAAFAESLVQAATRNRDDTR